MSAQLLSPKLKGLLSRLDDTPLHHLSLASLETFHSNCWAWLIQNVDQSAVNLFDEKIALSQKPFIHREKVIGSRKDRRILDLFIEVEHGQKRTVYIVENKLKSIISCGQLEDIERLSPTCQNFVVVSLFDYKGTLPPAWRHMTYANLSTGLRTLTAKLSGNRNHSIIQEYQKLVQTLSEIAAELQEKYITEVLDFLPSHEANSLSVGLEQAKLFSTYEKYRMSGLAKYLYDALAPELKEQGYDATFDSGEKKGNIFFEYGYSSTSQRPFAEFIIPICNSGARIGVQITRDRVAYFLDTKNGKCDNAAKALDKTDYWFINRKRKHKGEEFMTFGKEFRYECDILEEGTPYIEIVPILREGLKTALKNKNHIEKIVYPFL